jgi:hypothetical protein
VLCGLSKLMKDSASVVTAHTDHYWNLPEGVYLMLLKHRFFSGVVKLKRIVFGGGLALT